MSHTIIVNESCKTLRALGREALKGKWGLAVLGSLVYLAILFIPTCILNIFFAPESGGQSGIASIYTTLISGPMILGFSMFAISIFRRRETSVSEVLFGFEKFGKSLGLYIVMNIFIMLWSSIYIIYVIIVSIYTFTNMQSLDSLVRLYVLMICGLPLLIPGIIASLRYSMSYLVLADNPNIGIMAAINESKRLTNGNKKKLFLLGLSFIGWALLCIPTVGIGVLWLFPYMQVTSVALYDIANGSLRSSSNNGMEITDGSEADTAVDPITVYKEDGDTALDSTVAENAATETVEDSVTEIISEPVAEADETAAEESKSEE